MQKKNTREAGKKKTQAAVNESYLQTVFRRFRKHRLALVSFIVLVALVGAALLAPWIAPYDPNAIVGPFSGAADIAELAWHRPDRKRCLKPSAVCDADFIARRRTGDSDLDGDRRRARADRRLLWRDRRHAHHAFYGYGHVLSIHPARARGGSDLPSRPLEHHFDSRLRRLAGYRPPCARQRAQPARDELCKGPTHRRNAGAPHTLFPEILPNTVAPILVYATSVLALSMLDEAALSFLGLGVQPPTSSLGNMLNGAQSLTVLTKQPWLWIPAGTLIVILVMAINFIGDALRDALDPNSR